MAPASIKVFGILHLIFAGLAALGIVWAIVALLLPPGFGLIPVDDPQFQFQMRLQEQNAWMTWVTSTISLVVTGVMVPAGIKLLRHRRDALRWSNLYAWSSICEKVIGMVLTLGLVIPAMREILASSPEGTPRQAESLLVGSAVAGTVIGAVFTAIYPVLTLIFLNRRTVREWLAGRGT